MVSKSAERRFEVKEPRTSWQDNTNYAITSQSKRLIEEAFDEAKAKFASDLTQDDRKAEIASSATSLQDVQATVSESMTKYLSQRKESKAWRWLERLSHRIHFYGSVLDVFAQHHPEYVALVWGSIKFLIVAVENHGKVIATLAKAISQIADTLPRIELASNLYPTDRMRAAVTDLYVYILRFLIRARDWYEEGKLYHFLHSITRPEELRYKDLLEQISQSSRIINQLAVSGQQAEFRDIHDKINKTSAMVEKISNAVTLHSGALIDTNDRLSDLQFSQIMMSLSDVSIWDPTKVYKYHHSLKQRRSHTAAVRSVPNSFWQSPKLHRWSSTDDSALSIIVGNYHARFVMRNLCIDVIEQLHDAKVPVLLAMRVPQENGSSANISSNDLLKYLVRQAIQIRHKLQTEKSMAMKCATFHGASTETEWFQVLEAVLADIGSQVYIIVDLEMLNRDLGPVDGFSWVLAFEHFFNELLVRGLSTQVKVLLVSYSSLPFQLSAADRSKFVTTAKTQLTTARQRKAGRGVRLPQLPFRLKNIPGSPAKNSQERGPRRRP
ncbi:uncharacterized protein BDZ99DRAFT_402242 [Mytilinidion resinicola]|uniref:DUF7708 domain-containing protein n=1 Tax=Mytilinidion resinicola TaxID=574789 RepID=A0A6A6Y050_9PEZI|nr:uncharacterized protein BDZ99DRAFT_402242 [Mytilinidion resinicola]KAF2802196.1 hypothetical protein BDZ99DRAFT_402242 [Mytilinidion resinicola]